MTIKKQEFYEGAALYQLLQAGKVERVSYAHPFFILNDKFAILLKYSTAKDSPWNFVFTPNEMEELASPAKEFSYSMGLVCGSDGVVSLSVEQFNSVAKFEGDALRIGCHRKFDTSYRIVGPDGDLGRKISRSAWVKLLDGDCG